MFAKIKKYKFHTVLKSHESTLGKFFFLIGKRNILLNKKLGMSLLRKEKRIQITKDRGIYSTQW